MVVRVDIDSDARTEVVEERVIDLREPFGDADDGESEPGAHAGFDVGIVGLGYVGLPTALAFTAAGRRVLGFDISAARLADITAGRADLLERDRRRLADANQHPDTQGGSGTLWLTSDPTQLRRARMILICVPTPIDDHLLPDLGILRAACETVVEQAQPGQTIVLSSTTYVGCTTDLLIHPLAAKGLVAGVNVHVAFSPERIDPGNAGHDLEQVPRVVGGATPACTEAAAATMALYANRIHRVGAPEQAEMVKLVENTFRAVNIALANEFADICAALRLPVIDVLEAAATKPFGFMRFQPGPGVGGHCIPCDPHYLLWQLRRNRVRTPVISHAMAGIAERPGRVVERVRELLSANGSGIVGARVLIAGVTYKPDVADVRESPATQIIRELRDLGADVVYHDPLVATLRLPDGGELHGVADPADTGADVVLLHSLHTGEDLGWLSRYPLVLDATYRAGQPGVHSL